MANIKSRIETVRAQLENDFTNWDDALREAEKKFNTKNPKILARAMAQVLFGRPGRGRQVKDWSDRRLFDIAIQYHTLRDSLHKQGRLVKDTELVERLCQENPSLFGTDPRPVLKRLPAAKRMLAEEFAKDPDFN